MDELEMVETVADDGQGLLYLVGIIVVLGMAGILAISGG